MEKAFEKRRHSRVPVHFPVKFYETPASARVYLGAVAKDVSSGGVRFSTETFLPRNTRLFVEFSLPENGNHVKTFAKVAWMRTLPSGYRFEIGTEFTEMTEQAQDLLDSLTNSTPPRPA